jgi:glycosyltransferase involved in cell wall biosynthesis
MLPADNKTRLLILTPSLACGGSEKFVSLVCNHIDNSKFSVCLVIVNDIASFFEIKNPAIKIVKLKRKRVLTSLIAIKKAIKDYDPDIVFSTASHLNVYMAFFRKSFYSWIRFVAREPSIVSYSNRQTGRPSLYNRLVEGNYRNFDMIICPSVYMQQDLVNLYHIPIKQTMIIHNAVENISLTGPQPVTKSKERIYTFITVAGLRKEKGIERLIHAVGLLSVPFAYYIVGEGSKREDLQKLIDELQMNDKVFLTGQKDDPFSGMENADLFLMGSYYEGFPNVLLEAGAHGIPVVAFNAPGGIAEIITDNENGLLVDDNDIIAFAAAIKNALANNFDRDKIIETTRKRFSINSMMAAIENTFLKLAPNK